METFQLVAKAESQVPKMFSIFSSALNPDCWYETENSEVEYLVVGEGGGGKDLRSSIESLLATAEERLFFDVTNRVERVDKQTNGRRD